jgi:hypothetical protein
MSLWGWWTGAHPSSVAVARNPGSRAAMQPESHTLNRTHADPSLGDRATARMAFRIPHTTQEHRCAQPQGSAAWRQPRERQLRPRRHAGWDYAIQIQVAPRERATNPLTY